MKKVNEFDIQDAVHRDVFL